MESDDRRKESKGRAILVYGIYLLGFLLLTGSMFIAAAEFFPLMALMLVLWFALMWGVLSVLEFYLPWIYSSGFSRFFSMMGNYPFDSMKGV